MERHGGERPAPPLFPADGGHYLYDDRFNHFHGAVHQQHPPEHHHHHNFNGQQNESTGFPLTGDSYHSLPLPGHKRPFPHAINVDYGGCVKLYVVGIPRTATELDVSAVFGEFGDLIEVVLVRDKRTGIQQEYCFVKYARIEQAELAIAAFSTHFIFPGALIPLKVKYAERGRERPGSIVTHIHKLYVGCVNKQASRKDIEEIFSPFGVIEDIFIVRDENKQNRGYVFVQYVSRDMALAAIHALHGTYMMRGCDQPLIVRFADPKKPRLGDSRIETMASNEIAPVSSIAFGSSSEIENSIECDWSEHVSPDGEFYYYNCVTCESRWEKPEEYADYEEKLDDVEEQNHHMQDSEPLALSSPDDAETQKAAALA